MYQNKLVMAIKSNGKVLRENGDLVHLPFGSEFSILVKNLNNRRAKFKLHIDGTDVLDGTEIIVNANSETEIKRFIRNGNMNEGNAFKFIERTQAIEDGPRGIKIEDGIVRAEFWFEQERPVYNTYYAGDIFTQERYTKGILRNGPFYGTSGIGGSMVSSASATSARSLSNAVTGQSASLSADVPTNDVGITVPGSKVEQSFTPVYGFVAESQSHVIVLRMAGKIGEVAISAPVTVKTSQKCTTCGKVNKATAKFCSDCGTALTLL